MNVWLKSGGVWASPDSGILGFPVTGSGEMQRSTAVSGFLFIIVLGLFML